MSTSDIDVQKIRKLIEFLARKDYDALSPQERMDTVLARKKKLSWFFIANLLFTIFFFISAYMGITQLSKVWIWGIGFVFALNLYFIHLQKSQITAAITYLHEHDTTA